MPNSNLILPQTHQTLLAGLFSLLSLLLNSCSVSGQTPKPEATQAIFKEFQYQGLDSIFASPPMNGQFQNPILAGFYPDPTITKAGNTYYLANSSFGYTPGIPLFKSKNLIHWQPIGYALKDKNILGLQGQDISRGIYAPTLRFHKGTFYLITTAVAAGGNFLMTASNPQGPWSDPIWLPEVGGIDPDIFFDTDGKVYIAHNDTPPGTPLYNGHRAIWLWEFDLTTQKVVSNSKKLLVNGGVNINEHPIWIEGPHIYKHAGWYYLLCAEGGTGINHSAVVFRSASLNEPFQPYKNNPILSQRQLDPERKNPVTSAGHVDMIKTPNGDWWAVFLATRPYDQKFYNTGRETFLLPVTWKDGWPIILPQGEAIPLQLNAPNIASTTPEAQSNSPTFVTGNFTFKDNFNAPELNLSWNRLRYSQHDFVSLKNNSLILTPSATLLTDLAQPAFIGRRAQHMHFKAQTTLLAPQSTDIDTGLVAFQNANYHYFFGVKTATTGYTLFLEKVQAGERTIVATKALPSLKPNQPLSLGMEVNASELIFFITTLPNSAAVQIGSTQDARLLSTEVAGGFVGAYVGLHARIRPNL